jgi:molybdenum storage protein
MLIATGAGIRARHVFGVALDLGLPTGVLAALASTEAEQNGHMIAALLAEQGVSYLPHTSVGHQLAAHLAASPAAVSNGFPPYELFEFPPEVGKIPPHRTDAGAFLIADAYGAARTMYVKDVDGVYTHDPATAAEGEAQLLPRVGAGELLAMNLPTLPVDRLVLELMGNAKHVKEIQVVNGLVRGNVTKALAGEHVGTLIYAE